MKIFNEFGIKPTTNCEAAGIDFYIPNIKKNSDEWDAVLNAFCKSYKRSYEQLVSVIDELVLNVSAQFGSEYAEGNELNLLLLMLALDSPLLNEVTVDEAIDIFTSTYLVFDDNKTPGIRPELNDHVFFNSGIHVALDKNTAAIFFNKSGKGIKGWDVRACVVDEDYTGFVHLSLAYTKDNYSDGIIYCGDKITQMVILPIIHTTIEEADKDTYETLMSDSKRGSAGFGSSDEKH